MPEQLRPIIFLYKDDVVILDGAAAFDKLGGS